MEYRKETWRVWARFIVCVLFHWGSSIDGCGVCHLDYWREDEDLHTR